MSWFGGKETPEEYAERKEREAEEREARLAEQADNRDTARGLISRAWSVARSSDWKGGHDEIQSLRADMKAAGPFGRDYKDEIWSDFNEACDQFYSRRNAHYEQRNREHAARQAEFEKKRVSFEAAASTKRNLILRAKTATAGRNYAEIGKSLASIRADWKAAGHAGKINQELWDEFQEVCDSFYREREAQFGRNAQAKQQLIAKARSWVMNSSREISLLQKQPGLLMAEWKAIGSAGRDNDQALWDAFQEALSNIRSTVDDFYRQREQTRQKAESAKRTLILRASLLANSTDWKSAGEEIKSLQAQWKDCGSAGKDKEDALWREFRSACDSFFQKRDEAFRKRQKEREEQERKFQEAQRARENILSQLRSIIQTAGQGTREQAVSAVQSLQQEWKKCGHAGKESDRLHGEMRSLLGEFFGLSRDRFAPKPPRISETRPRVMEETRKRDSMGGVSREDADLVRVYRHAGPPHELKSGHVVGKDAQFGKPGKTTIHHVNDIHHLHNSHADGKEGAETQKDGSVDLFIGGDSKKK